MDRGDILWVLSTSVRRLILLGVGGVAVPVNRAWESGSCGGGAWQLAGWWLTGLGPQASGGLFDVLGLRGNDVHRV